MLYVYHFLKRINTWNSVFLYCVRDYRNFKKKEREKLSIRNHKIIGKVCWSLIMRQVLYDSVHNSTNTAFSPKTRRTCQVEEPTFSSDINMLGKCFFWGGTSIGLHEFSS